MCRGIILSLLCTIWITCNNADRQCQQVSANVAKKNMNVAASPDDEIAMYIGTYTRKEGHVDGKAKGVHLIYLNTKSGALRYGDVYNEAGINPSYLTIHPSGKFAFVVNETGGNQQQWGSVTALNINEDKSLTQLNRKSTEGIAPCHISLDLQGFQVLVANYGSGSIISFPVALSGKLGRGQNVIRYQGKGPHPNQGSPHAHYINQLKSGQIITADLGADSVRFHQFGSSQLQQSHVGIKLAPGAGPRHIEQHPLLPIIYILNELNATIVSYSRNADGNYTLFQTISTLADDDNREGSCAAIKMTSNGKYLYSSNRGDHNNIAIFQVNKDGQLSLLSHQSSLGNVPRDFAISPDDQYLVVANQNSDNLVSFKIDQTSGLLQNPQELTDVATPVCVRFYDPIL